MTGPPSITTPRIAITHDYLVQVGGAERVLEQLHALWPEAPIFTTFYDRHAMRAQGLHIDPRAIRPMLHHWLPHRGLVGKAWALIYPLLWCRLDLSGFDIVISSSSYAAHHVKVGVGARHICYCHTPPRFLYGLQTELNHRRILRLLPFLAPMYRCLRQLDRARAKAVTAYVANSREVARRILQAYGRTSTVVYPPVQTEAFEHIDTDVSRDYFLSHGRLVGSKRVEIAIQAAGAAGVSLVVSGTGADQARLRRIAGSRVRFVGHVSAQRYRELLAGCRALIFTAEEDFGIVPVEAMASGRPVIAYKGGGAQETVREGITGEFFTPQSAAALAPLLVEFDMTKYSLNSCRARALTFDESVFRARMFALITGDLAPTIASEQPIR